MRLRKDGTWLVAAALAATTGADAIVGGGGASMAAQTIQFDVSTDFIGDLNPALPVFTTTRIRSFSFLSNSDLAITNVTLRSKTSNDQSVVWGTMAQLTQTPGAGDTTGPGGQPPTSTGIHANVPLDAAMSQDQLAARAAAENTSSAVSLFVNTIRNENATISGKITINNLVIIPPVSGSLPGDAFGRLLFFQVDWSKSNIVGRSFSRQFMVTKPSDAPPLDSLPFLQGSDPAIPETTTVTPGAGSGDSGGGNGAGLGNSTTGPTSSGVPAVSSSSSASSSLSSGAIAGIAVACGIVGLAAVAAVVMLLMRRRRRQAAYGDQPVAGGAGRGPYGGHHQRTADLIAEKEATAGVTETPHSPYSDDGHGTQGEAAAAMLPQHQHQPPEQHRDFARYSDQQPSSSSAAAAAAAAGPAEHMSGAGSGNGGAQTPQLGGRYAHLMEEGMTTDEIARIEEEERQLDAAIERAGRS